MTKVADVCWPHNFQSKKSLHHQKFQKVCLQWTQDGLIENKVLITAAWPSSASRCAWSSTSLLSFIYHLPCNCERMHYQVNHSHLISSTVDPFSDDCPWLGPPPILPLDGISFIYFHLANKTKHIIKGPLEAARSKVFFIFFEWDLGCFCFVVRKNTNATV